jgi:hypothetical protein
MCLRRAPEKHIAGAALDGAAVEQNFKPYCGRREAVELLRFLLSPYSLIETCSNLRSIAWAGNDLSRHFLMGNFTNLEIPGPILARQNIRRCR